MSQELPLSAVMGPGAEYSGNLSFEGWVRVDGTFRGSIYTEGRLEIGIDGLVDGEADVASAVIAGRMEGHLRVRERLVVTSTGRIRGLLDASVVEIAEGASIMGEVRIRGRVER